MILELEMVNIQSYQMVHCNHDQYPYKTIFLTDISVTMKTGSNHNVYGLSCLFLQFQEDFVLQLRI